MKIIAVTSCPIGMAHTYMASAALKKAAKKKGVEIKVETQGSMGIRDKISKKEVEEADVLILAADIALLEGARFKNILTYKSSTSKIIKNCDEVIQKALEQIENENKTGE
ncbi:MAG: PTS fructose transporter subunit IIB [Anaerolineaceae bacterium]|nr:PTS fructose transporter subunit IIB [Anaerolineaceae bacterium]